MSARPRKAVELPAQTLERLRAPANAAVETGDVPGVISLVWQGGQILDLHTAGMADIEGKRPVERSTIFRIASMTKPVTVACALTLGEEGRMRLEDPITKWAPEFANMRVLNDPDGPLDDTYPAPRAITIEDLMTHRSGLTSYNFLTAGPLAKATEERMGYGIDSALSPDEWLAALASLPLAYAPGERFNYGFSIDALGLIVGRAAKTSFRQAMQDRVFAPLGMNDTDFWISPDKRERAAVPYAAGVAPGDFTPAHPSAFIGEAPQPFASGGQGLVSTADDYLTFARMLLGGGEADGVRLLQPETVRLMTTNRLTDAQRATPFLGMPFWAGQGFGLGMSVITDTEKRAWMGAGSNGAFGWPGAYGGWWQADPMRELILIWLVQAMPPEPVPGSMPRMPGTLARIEFQNQAYAALCP
jgi:CubicO group peptidase (beta-lactamase class C family)